MLPLQYLRRAYSSFLQAQVAPEESLDHNRSLNAPVKIGLEHTIPVLNLLLKQLSLLVDHPALDTPLFLDLALLLQLLKLLHELCRVAFPAHIAPPVALDRQHGDLDG